MVQQSGRLLKRRKELGLLQREVVARLGINHFTYITWEVDGRKPSVCYWPAIINHLGYDPNGAPATFAERIAAYRRRHGLTPRELAIEIGADPSTIASWETGGHQAKHWQLDELGRTNGIHREGKNAHRN